MIKGYKGSVDICWYMLRVAMSQGCEIWPIEFGRPRHKQSGDGCDNPLGSTWPSFACLSGLDICRGERSIVASTHDEVSWVAIATKSQQNAPQSPSWPGELDTQLIIAGSHRLGTYLWLSTDSCDGLSKWSKCLLLVWLINRNSLRAPSCLVFKTSTKLLSCSSAPLNISMYIWKWGAPWCPKFHVSS